MTQESILMWLISMPNSVLTVPQMLISLSQNNNKRQWVRFRNSAVVILAE